MGCACGIGKKVEGDPNILVRPLKSLPLVQPDEKKATNVGSEIVPPPQKMCLNCTNESTSSPFPRHTLDCSHRICSHCAHDQLDAQLRSKEGNIEYTCCICRAPKSLSIEGFFVEAFLSFQKLRKL